MKLLYVIVSLAYGGAERQFSELVKGVSKTSAITPYVCYLEKSKAGYSSELGKMGIRLIHLPRKSKYDISLVWRLARLIKELEIDVVHSFMSMSGLVACCSSRLCKCPVICSSVRDAKFKTSLKENVSLKVQAILSDILVANSKAGLQVRLKKTRPNYRVIYNGIDRTRFQPKREKVEELQKKYRLDRFDHIVSMIASLSDKKDHKTFLEGAQLVIDQYPRTGVLVVGDGEERNRLEESVTQLGIQDSVVFTGYTSLVVEVLFFSDVSVLMTNADIFHEGLSNSLLESMAMGVTIIASKGGGTDEIIEHGENGYLVAPFDSSVLADTIMRLFKDDILRFEMGEKGRLLVEKKFGFSQYIREYEKLYHEVLRTENG